MEINKNIDDQYFKFETIDLKTFSSIKIGYITNNIFFPENVNDLKKAIKYLLYENYNFKFSGGHTNILFHKKPNNTVFINFSKFNNINFKDNYLLIDSGVFSSLISTIAYIFGIKGYEFLHLLPGTIGGAVFMNARCYGGEIKDIIQSVNTIKLNYNKKGILIKDNFEKNELFDSNFKNIIEEKKYINNLSVNNLNFSYKHSIFQENDEAIISVSINFPTSIPEDIVNLTINTLYKKILNPSKYLDLENFYKTYSLKNINNILEKFMKNRDFSKYLLNINRTQILKRMEEIENDRKKKKHFALPSLGSIFKNNYDYGIPMGKLIEDLGLKGFAINDAQISNFHGNIIINKGNAKSEDVLKLIEIIKNKIKKNYGFIPEEEIIII